MWPPSCAQVYASDAVGPDLPGTEYQQEAPAAQDLAIPVEERGHRPPEPSLMRRYHLHSDAARALVPCRHHGLAQSQGAELAAIEQYGRRLLR